ncbi:hypothetical protein ACE6H2_002854 [Prunus campanulata]
MTVFLWCRRAVRRLRSSYVFCSPRKIQFLALSYAFKSISRTFRFGFSAVVLEAAIVCDAWDEELLTLVAFLVVTSCFKRRV